MAAVVTLSGTVYGNFILEKGDTVTLGRSLQTDLSVDDLRVSRRHCRLEHGRYGVVLVDLQSANGTFLNGKRINTAVLRPGDHIQVGSADLEVQLDFSDDDYLDRVHTCTRCQRQISLMTFAEGEVIQLEDQSFVCPQCREKEATPEFSLVELDVIQRLAAEGFEVQEKLSISGIVPIYRARKVALDQVVAIKALPIRTMVSQKKIDRFAQEAMVQARLRHRNIVTIYDVRQARDLVYIVMELIEGETLLQTIERSRSRMALKDTLRIGYHLARALDHAAQRGIIHRDVKPSNVMVSREGEAKLIDFGLGKRLDDVGLGITADGETLGTLGYMAPEQLGHAKEADHRADVYGLGATLYHCLTGRPPFTAVNAIELRERQRAGPPLEALTGVPLNMITLVARMMAFDPAERPGTPAEVLQGIETIVGELTGIEANANNVEFLLKIRDEESDLLQTWRFSAKRASAFLGSFRDAELVEFLQMVEFNRKTGSLRVVTSQGRGTVDIREGVVVAAEAGRLRDEQAVRYLLAQRSGDFEFTPGEPTTRRCAVKISQALLDAMRLRDEAR
ncbi:MAG: protein kinase [Planctomycetota bacterium]